MRTSEVWKKICGWHTGDYLKYLYVSSYNSKGQWLILKIIGDADDDLVKVEVLNKRFILKYFSLRLNVYQQKFPDRIRSYSPRTKTIKKFEALE